MDATKSSKTPQKPGDKVALQALSMAFGTMTSRILGLIRDMSFAAMFSLTVTDAWNVAFRLPNMFRRLLGEGSLSVSFIPIFVETRLEDPSGVKAQNLVNSFYMLLLLILTTLTTLGIVFAQDLVRLMIEANFDSIPGKFELTVRFAQIMFGFIFLMSTYAYFMGILNALGSFALPAVAPTFFNIAMIIANYIPKQWQVVEGDALAWGVIVGGVFQTGILIPALVRLGYFPKFRWAGWSPQISRIFKNMIPGMLGMGLLQITTLINTNFASELGEGSNSYIYYADRLLELPLSLVSVSLGTALLPTLSRLWAGKEKSKMVETANYYLRLNLFVAIPAALGLFFLGVPIVELLFQRGKFSPQDAMVTGGVLQVYAFTLVVSSSVRVLVPSFYAVKNTWYPAAVSGICLVLHILIAPKLMSQWGLQGLVLSTLLSALFNFIFLISAYPWMIGTFPFKNLLTGLAKFVVAGAGLGFVCRLYGPLFDEVQAWGLPLFMTRLFCVSVVILSAMATYAVISWVLGVEEFRHLKDSVQGRLLRKLKRKSGN